MSSDREIWQAIVAVTEDRLCEAERIGQKSKAEKLRALLEVLDAKNSV